MARSSGKERDEIAPVAWQFDWAKRNDVTQNTPPLVAGRLLVSKAASFGHKVGPEARCLAAWDCSVAFYHAPLDEDIVVVLPKGSCSEGFVGSFGGP